MPVGIGLHVLIALAFAVHAVRSGQERYWLFVLFAFPLLGSVVYALAVWLPEARHSRTGRQVTTRVKRAIDPTGELRAAQEAFDFSATTENRMRLAEALLGCGRASEAVPLYQAALHGVHRDDPHLQVRLALALLEAGHATAAREQLDALIRARPGFRSVQAHLIYARAVAAEGDRARAREEFEAVLPQCVGYEARARWVQQLYAWGETDEALRLRDEALREARRLPRHARQLNREWLQSLQQVGAR